MYHFPFRHTAAILTGLLFLMLFASTAATQEPAVHPFMPPLLQPGILVEDELDGIVTARLYGFNGTQGDSISVQMHSDELDAHVVLFGSGGEFLTYNDDADEAFGDAAIADFTLPYSGRYYVLATSHDYMDAIMVESLSLDAPQAYEIILDGNISPLDADGQESGTPYLSATSFELGQEVAHELTAEQPVGYFSFQAQAGDTASVYVESDDVRYPLLLLFAPDGSRISLSHNLTDPVENIELPLSGDYLVMVMDTFFIDRLLPNAGDYGLGIVTISSAS